MKRYPRSLGIIKVAVAGTPVRFTTEHLPCQHIHLTPMQDLTHKNAKAVTIENGEGEVFAQLQPDTPFLHIVLYTSDLGGAYENYDLSDWYVNGTKAGDGVLVGYICHAT